MREEEDDGSLKINFNLGVTMFQGDVIRKFYYLYYSPTKYITSPSKVGSS